MDIFFTTFAAVFPIGVVVCIVLWALTRPKNITARPGIVRGAICCGLAVGTVVGVLYLAIGRASWPWYAEIPYCQSCFFAASVIVDCLAKGKPLTW